MQKIVLKNEDKRAEPNAGTAEEQRVTLVFPATSDEYKPGAGRGGVLSPGSLRSANRRSGWRRARDPGRRRTSRNG